MWPELFFGILLLNKSCKGHSRFIEKKHLPVRYTMMQGHRLSHACAEHTNQIQVNVTRKCVRIKTTYIWQLVQPIGFAVESQVGSKKFSLRMACLEPTNAVAVKIVQTRNRPPMPAQPLQRTR